MSLNLVLDLPAELESRLRSESSCLEAEAKQAFALEMFRRGRLSHYELSHVLGLDRFETDALLKRHHVYEGSPTMADLEADRQTLERLWKARG
jgi:predicted HTH domain antitoxin